MRRLRAVAPSASEITRRYLHAIARHDLTAALELWQPGSIDRIVGQGDLIAPDGMREYFQGLFDAFPDFTLEIVELVAYRGRCAVRWEAHATFAGPGRFQGFAATGARVSFEGCDVLTITDGMITHNDAYVDTADIARQLGLLPASGSRGETLLARAANLRTRIHGALYGAEPELIAPGVWIVRGGRPRTMNAYLIEYDGGVTLFDAGISAMQAALSAAGARLGGIQRVILGHADCDHRGAAARLGAPIYCHPLEEPAARSAAAFRDYWDFHKLSFRGRAVLPLLLRMWDGGALDVAGTVEEGDEVAGFRVIELPGHAPGLIGLFRESDRLALVSDCFYTIDVESGRKQKVSVPHPAFTKDSEQARASLRKLASLHPAVAWGGHSVPVAGIDVERQLEEAAAAPGAG
jgi:glyoxylase-like metal-dependent hydrolase (beta-lactamase superfamily II)/predicted ester cyclase